MKKRAVIVRTKAQYDGWSGNKPNQASVGKIYETNSRILGGEVILKEGWTCKKGHYRLATPHEIDAFNKGIKHIKDIKIGESYKIF